MSESKLKELPNATSDIRISIAMATYNGGRFIAEQLASLGKQTLLPLELVVNDDGSTDKTIELIEEFARTAPFPVKIFRNEQRLGYADNFLHAASRCAGDLIAFCDQDDLWMSSKLEICSREFQDPDVLLCVHSGELFGHGVAAGAKCPGYDKRRVFNPLTIYPLLSSYGFAMLIRKTLLTITNNGSRVPSNAWEAHLAHDKWMWFLASVFGKIVLLPEVLVLYRQHDSNLFGGETGSAGAGISKLGIKRNYELQAIKEECAGKILKNISLDLADHWQAKAMAGATLLASCGIANHRRSLLYADHRTFVQRLGDFLTLVKEGGYITRRRATRIGLPAALKDMLAGLFRISRW